MKKNKLIYVAGLGLMLASGLSSCEDKLDVVNTNQQTTSEFGNTSSDLDEAVIACYNHIRMDGTFSRLGYLEEVCLGDEVGEFNDNLWWSRFDWYNAPQAGWDEQTSPLYMWSYAINKCNFVLYKVDKVGLDASSDKYKQIKGQALFIRGLGLYELATFYQDVPFTTNYEDYASLEGLYMATRPQSEVLDQAEADFKEAMELLPSRDEGGEWAGGRATCGAAAGYYVRTLMFRRKFTDALAVCKDILSSEDGGNQKYGAYKLMADYGDNFRSQSGENNEESLFEVQFLDYGVGGSDFEWGPVNNSKSATQGHAIETVFANGDAGGWNDLAAQPWLYQTFKSQTQVNGNPDPRLYWTLLSYEPEYDNMDGYSNTAYTKAYTEHIATGANWFGMSIAKHTTARENLYATITASGLTCGVNIRLLRYSDILLRAAECENEVNGPTANAFKWINKVRKRANLADLDQSKFTTADALFEQIANVERPTEFGCEHGRLQDLIRWGFFYEPSRLKQLHKHGCSFHGKDRVAELPATVEEADYDSFQYYQEGHEYMCIVDKDLNANYNLKGNSANNNTSNRSFYDGYTIHPVVPGIGVQ